MQSTISSATSAKNSRLSFLSLLTDVAGGDASAVNSRGMNAQSGVGSPVNESVLANEELRAGVEAMTEDESTGTGQAKTADSKEDGACDGSTSSPSASILISSLTADKSQNSDRTISSSVAEPIFAALPALAEAPQSPAGTILQNESTAQDGAIPTATACPPADPDPAGVAPGTVKTESVEVKNSASSWLSMFSRAPQSKSDFANLDETVTQSSADSFVPVRGFTDAQKQEVDEGAVEATTKTPDELPAASPSPISGDSRALLGLKAGRENEIETTLPTALETEAFSGQSPSTPVDTSTSNSSGSPAKVTKSDSRREKDQSVSTSNVDALTMSVPVAQTPIPDQPTDTSRLASNDPSNIIDTATSTNVMLVDVTAVASTEADVDIASMIGAGLRNRSAQGKTEIDGATTAESADAESHGGVEPTHVGPESQPQAAPDSANPVTAGIAIANGIQVSASFNFDSIHEKDPGATNAASKVKIGKSAMPSSEAGASDKTDRTTSDNSKTGARHDLTSDSSNGAGNQMLQQHTNGDSQGNSGGTQAESREATQSTLFTPHMTADQSSPTAQPAKVTASASPSHFAGDLQPDEFSAPGWTGTQGMNTARVIQNMSETEMRVGMRTQEFGDISIRTSVSQQQMQAQISVDHNELGKVISSHLPAVQTKLGADFGLQATIEVNQAGAFLNSGGQSSSQQHAGGSWRQTTTGAVSHNSSTESVAAAPMQLTAIDGRLDIRA